MVDGRRCTLTPAFMPFGADLLNERGNTLLVRWGSEAAEQCHVSYQLSVRAKEAAFSALENVDAAYR
ncbi:hypothetical protein DyAD56_11575 [Dyella sp. AD56]|nr:hypothetical protein DyAD56_11575 [Dyella sp. AD56]